jgi:Lectin C-type domain
MHSTAAGSGWLTKYIHFLISNEHVMNKISGLAGTDVWMGLMKTSGQNYSKWVDGKPLTYTDWDDGNPAQYSSENCAHFK